MLCKLITKVKCLRGSHDISSYAHAVEFDNTRMGKVAAKISSDPVAAFLELSSLRCKHCNYTYKAKTETDWSICDDK